MQPNHDVRLDHARGSGLLLAFSPAQLFRGAVGPDAMPAVWYDRPPARCARTRSIVLLIEGTRQSDPPLPTGQSLLLIVRWWGTALPAIIGLPVPPRTPCTCPSLQRRQRSGSLRQSSGASVTPHPPVARCTSSREMRLPGPFRQIVGASTDSLAPPSRCGARALPQFARVLPGPPHPRRKQTYSETRAAVKAPFRQSSALPRGALPLPWFGAAAVPSISPR